MPAAADSDNESVLSSLPSSPPADEQEDRDSLSEGEGEEQEQEQEHDMQRDESDAETEPLPPTSSARHGRTAAGPSSKRRHILQTESSSSDEHENAGDAARGRDTLAVPSASTQLPPAHSPKSRRMSFDDGSDLSALTSDADDGLNDEDEGDEDDDDGQDNGPTPRAAHNAGTSAAAGSSMAKRNVIGQRQTAATSRNGDREDSFDDEDEDNDIHARNDGNSTSMDEEGGDDEDEEDEYDEDDEDNDGSTGLQGRGRGRPPKRQNALAAAAKRAAARASSQGNTKGEDSEDDERGDSRNAGAKAEPLASDEDEGDEDLDSSAQAGDTSLKAKAEQMDSASLNEGQAGTAEDDDDEGLDPDEQLEQDMMADEAAELAKAARALDDSDDEDYTESSGPRSRAQQQQHTSARRRGQIHSGTAKNAARRAIAGQGTALPSGTPKRSNNNATGRDASASLPSSNSKAPLSPSSRNSGKAPNSASSTTGGATSSAKKRGGTTKRGAAGRAAAAALRNSSSAAARLDTEDDDDQMDVDSQARMTDDASDSDAIARKEEDNESHIGNNAQITVTDVNGNTERGEGSFMSGSAMSLPGSVAAAAVLSAATNIDTEDAMSGVSEDIPILLRATEQAQAQAASAQASSSHSIIPRLSISTTAAEAGAMSRDTATPEDDTTAPSTPLLPVPSSNFLGSSSTGARRKSPAPESGTTTTTTGRGRGRGGRGAWGRGRAKKLQQARMLAAQGDHDDEVSTSAAEDGHDRDGSPGHETGAGSDHDDETGDAGAAKKRQEAIEALTKIEIEFAQLRDKMYLEKMEEVAKERWQIENDVHPEHIHLMHLVEHRRTARLELARKNHKVAEAATLRSAESNIRYCWSQWMRRRHDLIREMVDDMNQKRRRLDREKRAIERPRNEELATILRIHAPPPYMFFEKKNPLTYGREYSLEYEVAENMQKKRKRGAAGLDHDEAMYDLERMGLRDPYRGTYPPHYHYDPAYAVGPPAAGPSRLPSAPEAGRPGYNGYPFDGPHQPHLPGPAAFPQQTQIHAQHASMSPSNNPLAAAQGRTVASVSQQQAPAGIGGRSDPFSAYRMQTPTGSLTPGGTPGSMHVQAQTLSHSVRAVSGPRPTLDDHLGYSTTGQARQPPVSQAARPGQRFDYTTAANKGMGDTPSSKFLPSYYAALGVQRT